MNILSIFFINLKQINMLYTIASVYDYKGGELSMNTNMTKEEVASEFSERVSYNMNSYTMSKVEIMEMVEKSDALESDTYAGCDGHVFEIYEQGDDGIMTYVSVDHFHEEIVLSLMSWQDEMAKEDER